MRGRGQCENVLAGREGNEVCVEWRYWVCGKRMADSDQSSHLKIYIG